jgi:cellulose synthase/poly-beta-1,6-N-acetylglucosamine synthase-like glycosyltransferase
MMTSLVDGLVILLAILLTVAVLPGSLYLALLSLAGLRRRVPPEDAPALPGPLAIVVPAHNESAGIARTVDNLVAITQQDGHATVCVIADNCNDDTAAIAAAHGARVLVRQNPVERGKGYALDFAFRSLAADGFAGYIVIDADSLAEPNLLQVIRRHFAAGATVVQTRYTVLNAEQSPRTQLAELALSAFNCLRPRGRHALGWSAGILGNGFALRSEVLEAVPYSATSVVEDLEYHLKLIAAGHRVHFADDTTVRGDMPVAGAGQKTQRARWEGGRLRMLLDHAGPLMSRVLRGEGRFLEPLADLMLLPLAYHSVLLMILALLPLPWAHLLGLTGLAILGCHVLIAARVGGMTAGQIGGILLYLPRYIFWKLAMVASIVRASKSSTQWVRTDRDKAP